MNSINFFAEQGQSILDKIINWSLTWGRAIVMLTELIALLAFLYRFGLDQQLADLNDKITQHELIIKASKNSEDNFRGLQHRLSLIQTYTAVGQTTISSLQQILDTTHGNVQFTLLSLTDNSIHASAISQSTDHLNAFINDLRNLSVVSDITITSIQSKQSTGQTLADITIALQSNK
jgi:Tfp pilus assembly protein PilN